VADARGGEREVPPPAAERLQLALPEPRAHLSGWAPGDADPGAPLRADRRGAGLPAATGRDPDGLRDADHEREQAQDPDARTGPAAGAADGPGRARGRDRRLPPERSSRRRTPRPTRPSGASRTCRRTRAPPAWSCSSS
jgi:hypothetical protein